MNEKIISRVKKETLYIINTNATLREIAKQFGVSKSTVHKDLQERLYEIDKNAHTKVTKILNHHLEIRHIRGGESTKQKYLKVPK